MPRNVTLGTLVTRCKQRADLENDTHIADSEWKALISEMNGEMQLVVAETGYRYFDTEATITATGAASYSLPADHLSTIAIEYVIDGAGRRRALDEIMSQEYPAVIGVTGEAFYFALVGQVIELYPKPASGSYKHRYLPQPPDLSGSADGTAVDVVTPDGEAFLIWGTAVKALAKSESDVRLAMSEREAARSRLSTWASMRSFHQPRRRVRAADDLGLGVGGLDPSDWRYRG